MSDADLQEIRKARLAQLQQEGGGAQSAGKLGGGTAPDDQQKQDAEARSALLAQILFPEAADRLGRIRLVKESRATDMENRLIMLARTGQLRSKVTEDQLKELLGAVAENEEKVGGAAGVGKIVISRRKGDWDDDDDLLDL